MYFQTKLKVEIGGLSATGEETPVFSFSRAKNVKITRSVDRLITTAALELPLTAVLKSNDTLTRTKTTELIKPGMAIKIDLGYTTHFRNEFVGYVRYVRPSNTLIIECEDAGYLLQNSTISKTYKETTLSELVNDICGDLVEIDGSIPEVKLKNYPIKNVSPARALQHLIDTYGFSIYFDLQSKLHVGLKYTERRGIVKYVLNASGFDPVNVINERSLKWKYADEVKTWVQAIAVKRDNTRITANVGDQSGSKITRFYYNLSGSDAEILATLKDLGANYLNDLVFDGFEGGINTFFIPYSEPGNTAELVDNNYPERTGNYFIKSVEVTWNLQGARRKVELGIKL